MTTDQHGNDIEADLSRWFALVEMERFAQITTFSQHLS